MIRRIDGTPNLLGCKDIERFFRDPACIALFSPNLEGQGRADIDAIVAKFLVLASGGPSRTRIDKLAGPLRKRSNRIRRHWS